MRVCARVHRTEGKQNNDTEAVSNSSTADLAQPRKHRAQAAGSVCGVVFSNLQGKACPPNLLNTLADGLSEVSPTHAIITFFLFRI